MAHTYRPARLTLPVLLQDDRFQHRRQTLYWWYARWGLGLEAAIHTMFLGISLWYGVLWMALAQLAYLFGTALALYFCYIHKIAWSLLVAACVIVVQEPVSTAYFGWDSGFWLYLMVLPQVLFLLREIRAYIKLPALVAVAVLFVLRSLTAPDGVPIIDLGAEARDWLLRLNVTTVLIVLAVLSYLQAQTSARLEEELAAIAITDPLTGLYNRRALMLMAADRIRRCVREQQQFCAALLDIDHFKKINDQYGHDTGDRILVLAAQLLTTRLKAGDTAFRWGGEEFVILFGSGNLASTVVAAERLRLDMAEASTPEGLPAFTVTIGVAEWLPGESIDALFRRADAALYAGKHNGRNQISVAPQP